MSVHDTTTADSHSPLDKPAPSKRMDQQLKRLAAHLEAHYPAEFQRQNLQEPEAVADIAIRLLTQYEASSKAVVTRCKTEYCNKPSGHRDEHGWVG